MFLPIAKQSRAFLASQQAGNVALSSVDDFELEAAIKSLNFDFRRYTDRSAPRNDLYADLANKLLFSVARLELERSFRIACGVYDWALSIGYQNRASGERVPSPYNNRGTRNNLLQNSQIPGIFDL